MKMQNPGSDDAVGQGCECLILDNGHGRLNGSKGPFWISENCPVHAGKEEI